MSLKIIPLLLLWSLLWLAGSYWAAEDLEHELNRAAQTALAGIEEAQASSTQFSVQAHGQQLVLQGKAHRESDLQRALQLLREQVRIEGVQGLGRRVNPVRAVANDVAFELKPPGWGVLTAVSDVIQLQGITGSEFESQVAGSSVSAGGQLSRLLSNGLESNADACVESDQMAVTTASDLKLGDAERQQGLLAFTRWGKPWQTLDLDLPVETLRRHLVEAGLPSQVWTQGISTAVERVRDVHFNWRSAQAEQQRLAAQPPGHVVLAMREDTVLLRGELGSAHTCKLLEDAVRQAAGEHRVTTELLYSTRRRPEAEVVKLATTVPALTGGVLFKLLAVGTPAQGWKIIDLTALDMEDERALSADQLPQGLDSRLVMPDVLAAVSWMHSDASAPARKPGDKPLPYVLLASVGEKVLLRGRVAEESSRTQIEEAARRLYQTRTVDAAIQLDTTCEPVRGVLPTVSSLPPLPVMNGTGLLALAVPGQNWRSQPMRPALLEAKGLMDSGLLPAGVTANQVMPALLEMSDAIQAHLRQVLSGTPGIPLQSPTTERAP